MRRSYPVGTERLWRAVTESEQINYRQTLRTG
jgi:hypothetical protein